MNNFTTLELAFYARQLELPNGFSKQQQLKNAKVVCIGAGGLASSLLFYLAAAGIGRLGIVDGDKIATSNLHRQILYTYQDIGKLKVHCAAQRLAALNPFITLEVYEEYLCAENAVQIISSYDLVIDATDNFAVKYLINDITQQLAKPFLFAGVARLKGICGLFYPAKGPCLRCIFPQAPKSSSTCNSEGIIGVVPGIFGSFQALETIKFFTSLNYHPAHLLHMNMETLASQLITIGKNPRCTLCCNRLKSKKPLRKGQVMSDKSQSSTLTLEELQHLLKTRNDICLIDVRSYEEHDNFNIGGQCIPLNEIHHRLLELNPSQLIITYCAKGIRSKMAAEILRTSHFEQVLSLEGGIHQLG